MNFEFDLDVLVPFEVTKYNSDLKVISDENQPSYQFNIKNQSKLAHVIDRIGEASSRVKFLFGKRILMLSN